MTETMNAAAGDDPKPLKSLFDLALEKAKAAGGVQAASGDLGVICWWGFQGVEITVDELRQIFTTLGLDAKSVPVPEARGALKDAADSLKLKFRLGRHRVDDERFAISFDTPHLHQNGSATVDVDYKVEQVVEYNFTTKQLTFKNSYMEQEIRSAFTKYLTTLQSNDVRSAVMREIQAVKAITLRDRGGVYFVPAKDLSTVMKLKTLCEEYLAKLPGAAGCYFDAYTIQSSPAHKATMARSAGSEIEDELKAAEEDLAKIQGRLEKKEKVRVDTLDRRVKDFSKLREKAIAYAELLGMKQESVVERIEALKSAVMELACS